MKGRYHNTTGSEGSELAAFERQAASQEDKIQRFFEDNAGIAFTPSQIWRELMQDAPLTSVRRAISNLTYLGELVKLSGRQRGPYGRPEHLWVSA